MTRPLFCLALLALLPFITLAQQIDRVLLIREIADTAWQRRSSFLMDAGGNYAVFYQQDTSYYWLKNGVRTGPWRFQWSSDLFRVTDSLNRGFYLSRFGDIVSPSVSSREDNVVVVSPDKHHAAVALIEGNAIVVYKDGRKLATMDERPIPEHGGEAAMPVAVDSVSVIADAVTTDSAAATVLDSVISENETVFSPPGALDNKLSELRSAKWLSINDHGDCLYTTVNDGISRLFLNDSLIGSDTMPYESLHLHNDRTVYYQHRDTLYAGARRIRFNLRWMTDQEFTGNGGYFYKSDASIVINNVRRDTVDLPEPPVIPDNKHFLFYTQRPGTSTRLVTREHTYNLLFSKLFYPAMDTSGQFACFGLRDYYLYRCVNGIPDQKPLTRYGVRPVPLQITPAGSAILYYRTDDSTYIYRDDELLFPPFSNQRHFRAEPQFTKGRFDKNLAAQQLSYLQLDSVGYIIYSGRFSAPMPTIDSFPIIAGRNTEHGFFVVQKTAHTYRININNRYYQDLDELEDVRVDEYYFDDHHVRFPVKKGNSVYQYTLTYE